MELLNQFIELPKVKNALESWKTVTETCYLEYIEVLTNEPLNTVKIGHKIRNLSNSTITIRNSYFNCIKKLSVFNEIQFAIVIELIKAHLEESIWNTANFEKLYSIIYNEAKAFKIENKEPKYIHDLFSESNKSK